MGSDAGRPINENVPGLIDPGTFIEHPWSCRLRRIIRFENREISPTLATHRYDLGQSEADERAEPESTQSSDTEIAAMTDYLYLAGERELDKLLRYEAMINRLLSHEIPELERVQARRRRNYEIKLRSPLISVAEGR